MILLIYFVLLLMCNSLQVEQKQNCYFSICVLSCSPMQVLHSFEQRQKVRVFLIIFTGILMPYS